MLVRLRIRRKAITISASVTFALVGVFVAIQAYGFDWTRPGGDPWSYLAAGERLNAGHNLYALQIGDRDVYLRPPYWSVPLLAPPPIAVAWRPLALLGEPAMTIWGFTSLVGTLASVGYLLLKGRLAWLALLAMPLTLTALSGNFSALLLPISLGAWMLRDRPIATGALIAIGIAVKLTPAIFLVWLALTRRWLALAAAAAIGGAILAVASVAGGQDSWTDWLGAAVNAAPSPLALSTITRLPPLVVGLLLALPLLVVHRSDVWTFRTAAIVAAVATPALYFQAIGLLAVALVPRGNSDDSWHSGVA